MSLLLPYNPARNFWTSRAICLSLNCQIAKFSPSLCGFPAWARGPGIQKDVTKSTTHGGTETVRHALPPLIAPAAQFAAL